MHLEGLGAALGRAEIVFEAFVHRQLGSGLLIYCLEFRGKDHGRSLTHAASEDAPYHGEVVLPGFVDVLVDDEDEFVALAVLIDLGIVVSGLVVEPVHERVLEGGNILLEDYSGVLDGRVGAAVGRHETVDGGIGRLPLSGPHLGIGQDGVDGVAADALALHVGRIDQRLGLFEVGDDDILENLFHSGTALEFGIRKVIHGVGIDRHRTPHADGIQIAEGAHRVGLSQVVVLEGLVGDVGIRDILDCEVGVADNLVERLPAGRRQVGGHLVEQKLGILRRQLLIEHEIVGTHLSPAEPIGPEGRPEG